MWIRYNVELAFVGRLVGGVALKPPREEKNNEEQVSRIGFLRDEEKGLFVEARQIKAGLKKAANVCKKALNFPGYMRARLSERVFIMPNRIFLGRDKPDGTFVRYVHVVTPKGPRSAKKFCDYVLKPVISFNLFLLDDGVITERHLIARFDWLGQEGLGAERSQGEGKFLLKKLEAEGKLELIGECI